MEHSEKQVTVVPSHPVARGGALWAMTVTGIAFLGIVGYAVYAVREYIPLLGYAVLAAIGILIVAGVVWALVALTHYLFKVTSFDIGEFGTVLQHFGHRQTYAPVTTNTVKVTQRKGKSTVTEIVPTIIELIDTGVIAQGQLAMHMGFEQTKGGLFPVIDAWPGTFAIAGMGRSGKTRRVISVIFQAVMGGARVIVCDPHANKPDGLGKELRAVAQWVGIIEGAQNCAGAARMFLSEMKRRVNDPTYTNYQPWLIIFDEWSMLMTDRDISDEDKEAMIEVVEECSTQYAGFQGFAGIIGQKWLNDESGGTTIRRSLHKVFVHRLHPDFAKFFLPAKYAKQTNELLTKECFYQESTGGVKRITTIEVPNDAAEWFASWLAECMPDNRIPAAPASTYKRLNAPLRNSSIEHEINEDGKGVNASKEPVEPLEDGEGFTVDGEGFTTDVKELYTPSEETQIVLAAQQIAQENGGKVTRQAIRDRLGWNVRKHSVVKAVCDKHGIARI